MTEKTPTRIGGIRVLWMERVRGVAITIGLILAGIVLTVRGADLGLILVAIGVAFGVWVARWPK